MLVDGLHQAATLTNDTDRLHAFYESVFDARITLDREVLVLNPEAEPGVHNKPGTPAARFAGGQGPSQGLAP